MTTPKHQEEARELVLRVFRLRSNTQLAGQYATLVDAVATALSSRDAEIREVLEGLRDDESGCWCVHFGSEYHTNACLAARVVWDRLQS